MAQRARGRPRGGAKQASLTETVTIRLDPRLRYLTALGARKQRRTVSAFIHWATEQVVADTTITVLDVNSGTKTILPLAELWDSEEGERLARLARTAPVLLTYEEELIWKRQQEGRMYGETEPRGDAADC